MGKGNLNIRGNMMHVFTVSFPEIIINGEFLTVPHTTKYFHTLGTNYINRYRSIRNICRNRHKSAIVDIADENNIVVMLAYYGGHNPYNTISYRGRYSSTYNTYHKFSRFK